MKRTFQYRLSCWAKKHQNLAISAIILAKVCIAVIGFVLGVWAWTNDAVLQYDLTLYSLAAVSIAVVLAYPRRPGRCVQSAAGYRRQKRVDAALVAIGFAAFFSLGNLGANWSAQPPGQSAPCSGVPTLASSLEKKVEKRNMLAAKNTGLKHFFRQKAKSGITRLVKGLIERKSKGSATGDFLLELLSVAIVLLLGFLVVALSCQLACTGQEAVGAIVLIFGVIGVIGLAGLLARAGRKRRQKRKQNLSPPPEKPIDE